jgi:Golgi SNAP receptor complex protein 1
VDDLLEKLEETNEQLALLANNPDSEISQSMNRAIQRHRDVYHDYARELKRTKANVQQAIDQSNLLSGVRNDIDAYKSSAAESLLAERSRIDGSHAIADEMLEQAFETRSEFSRQRHSLTAINTRMTSVISTIPGVNKLVSMISSRRRRDTIILGVVIGVCILIILTYAWR